MGFSIAKFHYRRVSLDFSLTGMTSPVPSGAMASMARQPAVGPAAPLRVAESGGWRLSDLFGTTHDRPHDQDRRRRLGSGSAGSTDWLDTV